MNLDKIFHLKENHTDVKTEVIAGITTFMTMAYIRQVAIKDARAVAVKIAPLSIPDASRMLGFTARM